MVGTLYVVGTPIGNLEDITLRAIRILKEVDAIVCEDTRTTMKLLAHLSFAKPLLALYGRSGEGVLQRLRAGESVALVSESGTPGVSDPGAELVAAAHEAGLPVRAVPGPSAAVAAASVSGLPTDEFVFTGFLPRKPGKRRKALAALAGERRVIIVYESPHRVAQALEDMLSTLGDRPLAVARELTKVHEEVTRTTVARALDRFRVESPRGEFVLVVAPAPSSPEE
ncbi:MAG: 16S rRNA (cytidine(1402)-2'-O)-methyltransferase [Planctomycetes bacterium]|nr:16S rRNA (cytidine(1402)-2'-O)-methyltransferase [Planctomycetota bacterium]